MAAKYLTPGVYIKEINAFPNSVVALPTALPAFIGYTQRASYKGKSYTNIPVRIESLADYIAYFAFLEGDSPVAAPEIEQYHPIYYATVSAAGAAGDIEIGGKQYDLEPDPSTVYYLYNCIKLFYKNGGGPCYVVSVGGYGEASGSGKSPDAPLVNPDVTLADLLQGLDALRAQQEPTLIVIPDGLLLGAAEYGTLLQSVLKHCSEMKSRIGIFDIQGGDSTDRFQWMTNCIEPFRNSIGINFLNYGTAYFPFLYTTILVTSDINYDNLGGPEPLKALLPDASTDPVKTLLEQAGNPPSDTVPGAKQIHASLIAASPTYKRLCTALLFKMNTLPPSAAMAGIYATVDDSRGVWVAPANVGVSATVDLPLHITDEDQEGLNVDAIGGKSINAIRYFPGTGVLVWGARTLDGNSDDWKYVNVRRTLIWIEQSLKMAAYAYVFEPNDANTWSLVQSMFNSFLTNLWNMGALVGATPDQAFGVAIGLGVTMSPQDILDGVMNIMVKVAISHPAEFVVIQIQQQQQTS